MSEIGGELGAMSGMVSTFHTQQASIEQVVSAIGGQINSSPGWWKGPRADRFRGQWPEFQAALQNLHAALGECATEVQSSANGLQSVGG
ncbi:MAG: WXG100 family type VII secretion target [Patulibacter minatonensis]